MKIVIDRQKCMGSGNCAFHAPHTFDLDDEMKAVVIDRTGDTDDALESAAEGCPTYAIAVDPDPT